MKRENPLAQKLDLSKILSCNILTLYEDNREKRELERLCDRYSFLCNRSPYYDSLLKRKTYLDVHCIALIIEKMPKLFGNITLSFSDHDQLKDIIQCLQEKDSSSDKVDRLLQKWIKILKELDARLNRLDKRLYHRPSAYTSILHLLKKLDIDLLEEVLVVDLSFKDPFRPIA